MVNYFLILFSLSLLNKEELKAYESLKSVSIRMGQGSKSRTVFKLPAEIILAIGQVRT